MCKYILTPKGARVSVRMCRNGPAEDSPSRRDGTGRVGEGRGRLCRFASFEAGAVDVSVDIGGIDGTADGAFAF